MNGHNDNGVPRMFYDDGWEWNSGGVKKFSLGHSCGRWVIGTLEEAIEFHKILGSMIEEAKNNPNENQATVNEDE